MTNTFIPTLGRRPLYCFWVGTGNPEHPLDRAWIDPELRSFQSPSAGIAAPTRVKIDGNKREAKAELFPEKSLSAQRAFLSVSRPGACSRTGGVNLGLRPG